MRNFKLGYLFLFFFCVSCKNEKNERMEYFPNGAIKTRIQYVNNFREGTSVEYYENGQIKVIHNWENDTLQGETHVYNEQGSLIETVHFEKGVLNGDFCNFFRNANIRMKGKYNEGIMHGKVIQYFENDSGRVKAIIHYLNYRGNQKEYGSVWYDSLGNIVNDIRRIEVKAKKDTITMNENLEVEIELKQPHFDSTQFIIGDYNNKFFITDSAKFDTLNASNHKSILFMKPLKKGDNFIRGYSVNFRTLSRTLKETKQEFISPIYFEYSYYVK